MKTYAFTGHRPDKLGGYDPVTRRALGGFAVDCLFHDRPDKAIVGMALGFDQAVAGACVVLGIPFVAAVPFSGQERRWPAEAQTRYKRLLAYADSVEIVADGISVSTAMQKRNEWMVDRCNKLITLWDGSFGGTCNCVAYAEKRKTPIVNWWDLWSASDELRDLLG